MPRSLRKEFIRCSVIPPDAGDRKDRHETQSDVESRGQVCVNLEAPGRWSLGAQDRDKVIQNMPE